MKKEVAILMVISLIVGFLIGYGYMSIRINKMEATIKELRESLLDDALDRALLKQCLNNAYEVYRKGWNQECERIGEEEECALPFDMVDRLDRRYEEMKEDCFKKYPQK